MGEMILLQYRTEDEMLVTEIVHENEIDDLEVALEEEFGLVDEKVRGSVPHFANLDCTMCERAEQ